MAQKLCGKRPQQRIALVFGAAETISWFTVTHNSNPSNDQVQVRGDS
jgi:hypothetical protein